MSMLHAAKRRLFSSIAIAVIFICLAILYLRPSYSQSTSDYLRSLSTPFTDSASAQIVTWASQTTSLNDLSASSKVPTVPNPIESDYDDDDDADEFLPFYYSNPDIHELKLPPLSESHYVVESLSGPDGSFTDIDFLGRHGMNPNIIPHDAFEDKWVIVAQSHALWQGIASGFCAEMTCLASFVDGQLVCEYHATTLPIATTISDNCAGEHVNMTGVLGLSIGPHDARVFMGPENPFIIYGSQSQHHGVCFGQWIQDFRFLVEWGPFLQPRVPFGFPTDIQRPAPVRPIEKNYFIFWSADNVMYVHYDLEPRRVFAEVGLDGLAGKNLARHSRVSDQQCWSRFRQSSPWANGTHQGTNSLSVTLCRRADLACVPDDENTFIMHIFQKKLAFSHHQFYLPYVLLFRRTPPFAFYAITKKPFWLKGQRPAGEAIPEEEREWYWGAPNKDEHEMIYITSFNWKKRGNRYHGFLDDELFLSFGREDTFMSVMDTTPERLIGELMFC